MKNNNFQQPQNILNNSLNKNPSQIQNFNYMIHLYPDNSNMYNIQNLAYPLYQLNFLQNNPQYQLLNLANMQNVYPFYYNLAYNNLLRLNLLNYNKNLSQNQNFLSNLNNLNNFQNNIQNNILLNKKTFNQSHREFDAETTINEKKDDNIDNEDNKDNNKNNNEINSIKKENEISPEKNEDKSKYEIKSEIKTENNSEEKSIEEVQDKNNIIENIENKKAEGENEENNEKNEISTSNHEEKLEENKKENKKETKKKKKRRTNYKELLYDTLLEKIGIEEKQDKNKNNELEEETSSINESTKKKLKNKKTQNPNTQKSRQKPRTKNGRHSRKKQHKITLKNNKDILADLEENKNDENNSKFTKIIFHGKDYQETKNMNDFMKYNFDFIIDEQYKTKKLITDYDQQHIDEKTLNGKTNIYDNYNYSEQHLDEIKNMWSREKFLGDNKELKRAINVVRDTFNERKMYSNEEKYLNIIKNNNYSIDGFDNKKN